MSIECRSIHKTYKRRAVLADVNAHFSSGKCHCIIGGNGAGKTTLLKIMAGLEKQDGGEIRLPDKCITYSGSNPYMLQGTVRENIAYPMTLKRQGASIDVNRIETICKRLGLDSLMQQEARTLSAGEKQKVALARAMVWDPEILLLDEPTANIDRDTVESIEKLLGEFVTDSGRTLIVVSHDHGQAIRISDSIWRLDCGRLIPVSFGRETVNMTIDKETAHGILECR